MNSTKYVFSALGAAVFACSLGVLPIQAALPGTQTDQQVDHLWRPLELTFSGPHMSEGDTSPNPFLDYRLQVTFTRPSGTTLNVPGFFDGDGNGSGLGKIWKLRVSPDELGHWTWTASFRTGTSVAIDFTPTAGSPTAFDGASGSFEVDPPRSDAEGFYKHGRLDYVGGHYLRFSDGTYFLKTGTNSPENLFGYRGFDNVQDMGGLPQGIIHEFGPHVGDWRPGEPSVGSPAWPDGLKGIIGALNYMSSSGVNAVYFLPMNLGGDGQETAPFLSYDKTFYAKTHYDVSRLHQWNMVMEHAMRRGIQLQIVLAETEIDNETWLDDGALGTERMLFFRELVARFSHHLAIKWNMGEEPNFDLPLIKQMANYLLNVDPYDHPVAFHTHVDSFGDYAYSVGDPLFSATSIQYSNDQAGDHVEDWRENSAAAGIPWVIDMDENGTPEDGVSDTNADQMRKQVLYDVLFSGGNVEWYLGSKGLPLGGDQSIEDFRSRAPMWRYSRYAREFIEAQFQFWLMEPSDHLLSGESTAWGGGEVLGHDGWEYGVYLPNASLGATLDLSNASQTPFQIRWFNPREGHYEGTPTVKTGGAPIALGSAPSDPDEDWVVHVERADFYSSIETASVGSPVKQDLLLDAGPAHSGEKYLVLAGYTGCSPGTTLFNVWMPLNYDEFTFWTLMHPYSAVTLNFFGTLDSEGRAVARVDLPTILSPGTVGMTITYVYLRGVVGPDASSKAINTQIVP